MRTPLPTRAAGLKGDFQMPTAADVAFAVALNGAFVTPGLYVAGVRGWRLLTGSMLGGLSYVFFSVLWERYMHRSIAAPQQQTFAPPADSPPSPAAGTGRVIDVPPRRK